MNYKMMGRFIGLTLSFEGLLMFPAMILGFVDGDTAAALSFMVGIAILLLVGGGLIMLCRGAKTRFFAMEGMVCVGCCWLIMSALGCLPFCFSGDIPNYLDALFEMVSGFTTTGASILRNVEGLTRASLYWRSFSHWLGGMGVLVFLLAIVPSGSRNSGFTLHLLKAESPGPEVSKLVPHTRQTAVVLYGLYIGLTVLNIIFLMAGGLPWFDSICTAFGTAGTGGFGIKNDSIASYSPYIQNVTTVFMLLFGVNFSCYFLLCLRHYRSVFKDEELRLYLGTVLGSIALIAWNIHGLYPSIGESIRHAAFQVSSIITTTGFATTDFDLWPSFSKGILLCLMVVGACAGSTGGGIKCARMLLLVKSIARNVRQLMHPHRIQMVRVNGRVIDEKVLANTNAYLAAYVAIIIGSFLLVSIDGFSVTTNFSAVLACFNNIGPGLDLVGPTGNYADFGILSKLILIFDMLAGRLEIFPILSLFAAGTWKRR